MLVVDVVLVRHLEILRVMIAFHSSKIDYRIHWVKLRSKLIQHSSGTGPTTSKARRSKGTVQRTNPTAAIYKVTNTAAEGADAAETAKGTCTTSRFCSAVNVMVKAVAASGARHFG